MEYNSFNDLINDNLLINPSRKYWLVRTMGGSYYGEFVRGGYIAIGYNAVSLNHLNTLSENLNIAKDELKRIFKEVYPSISNTGYPVSQLIRFFSEIKDGDIVIIPSEAAKHVAIGVVDGSTYETGEVSSDSNICQFRKRRNIDWKHYSRRSVLPPALQLVFNSRHIISDVTSYADHIEGMVNDIYKRDDTITLVLRIRTQKDVALEDFCSLQSLEPLVYKFCKLNQIEYSERISMKIQMESPGWLKLSSKNGISSILILGLFILFINGGGVEIGGGQSFKMYTNGIFGSISEYLDREADRELIQTAKRAIDSLQIKNPDDLKPIIEMLEKKNESRNKY